MSTLEFYAAVGGFLIALTPVLREVHLYLRRKREREEQAAAPPPLALTPPPPTEKEPDREQPD